MVENQEQNNATKAMSKANQRPASAAVLFQAPTPFSDSFSAPSANVSRTTKMAATKNAIQFQTGDNGQKNVDSSTGNSEDSSQKKKMLHLPVFAAAPILQLNDSDLTDREKSASRKQKRTENTRFARKHVSDSEEDCDDQTQETTADGHNNADLTAEVTNSDHGRREDNSGLTRRRRHTDQRGKKEFDSSQSEQNNFPAEAEQSSQTPGWHEAEEGTQVRRIRRRRSRNDRLVEETESALDSALEDEESGDNGSHRVRRRRSRNGSLAEEPNDQITVVKGSTRLEAKKQRRREGQKEGRRHRAITESEYLARRESVNRQMLIRSEDDLNQIAVLEDKVLVEHYVSRQSESTLVGSVFLGRVQNVLPSMEAAFVDLGKGRNAVLYAGEVNWDAAGLQGSPRRIESALKPGDAVTVQVTKDPIGHKGARLTSQITLPGRYLVLVPGGTMTGISRKLPETERQRLKKLLRRIVPKGFGVIIRTAAEGSSEEQLEADVLRLTKQWEELQKKSANTKSAPVLLYGEPELSLRVVRDIFNEDFEKLIIQGKESYQKVSEYVKEFAPDLQERVELWVGNTDIFQAHRVDEQLAKGMDRKVWLPSGGYLIIDRTEAMTVIDVNTGKYTGSGGTLEETVTRNNLEAAEEIMRQLRLRDIGGIVVIDFVDMVLESNRDLVLRRLIECLGRDRTRHQVTEVTSLGLVQMTRKRVGEGLVEAFSTPCDCCDGRGFIVHSTPVERTKTGRAIAARVETDRKRDKDNSVSGKNKGSGRGQKVAVRKRDLKAQTALLTEEEPNPHQEANQKSMAKVAAAAKASRQEQRAESTDGKHMAVKANSQESLDSEKSVSTLSDPALPLDNSDSAAATGKKKVKKAARAAVQEAIAQLTVSIDQSKAKTSAGKEELVTGGKKTRSSRSKATLEAEIAENLAGKMAAKRAKSTGSRRRAAATTTGVITPGGEQEAVITVSEQSGKSVES